MQARHVGVLLLAVLASLLVGCNAGNYVSIKIVENESTQKSAVTKAFKKAAKTWSKIIKTNQDTITFSSKTSMKSQCGVDYTFSAGSKLKNLVVFVSVTAMDGVGGVLGSAGPCGYSTKNGYLYPRLGIMNLDSADLDRMVARGTLQEVITHELGHVLGFGTLWSKEDLTSGSSSIVYTGDSGVSGYESVGGPSSASSVPVQSTGASGTKGVHWSETTFKNELMTGTLNSGSKNPLSKLSVASMKDLGYSVNMGKAESYSMRSSSKSLTLKATNDTADDLESEDDVSFDGDFTVVNRSEALPVFTDTNGTIEYIIVEPRTKASPWEIAVTTIAAACGAALIVVTALLCCYRRKLRLARKAAEEESEAKAVTPVAVDAKCETVHENPAATAAIEAV